MVESVLEADEPAEQGVVEGVGVTGLPAQELVETVFGIANGYGNGWQFQPGPAQSWFADGEETGGDGDVARSKVGETVGDTLGAGEFLGQVRERHGWEWQNASTTVRKVEGSMAG